MAWKTGEKRCDQARAGAAAAGVVSDRFGAVDRSEAYSGSPRSCDRLAVVRADSGRHVPSHARGARHRDAADGGAALSVNYGCEFPGKVVPFCAYEFLREPLEVVGSKLASPTGFEPVLPP